VLAALRERLHRPESVTLVIARVRDDLLARARREARGAHRDEYARQLRAVEKEFAHIKNGVMIGKATESLLGMLEDAERRRKARWQARRSSGAATPRPCPVRVLSEVPEGVQTYLENLEALLGRRQRKV